MLLKALRAAAALAATFHSSPAAHAAQAVHSAALLRAGRAWTTRQQWPAVAQACTRSAQTVSPTVACTAALSKCVYVNVVMACNSRMLRAAA